MIFGKRLGDKPFYFTPGITIRKFPVSAVYTHLTPYAINKNILGAFCKSKNLHDVGNGCQKSGFQIETVFFSLRRRYVNLTPARYLTFLFRSKPLITSKINSRLV